jgi:predicted RNase H-like HicB family nuclease
MEKTIQLHKEGKWIVAECPELPGCVSQGRSQTEALANIRDAIGGWLWAEEQKAEELLR